MPRRFAAERDGDIRARTATETRRVSVLSRSNGETSKTAKPAGRFAPQDGIVALLFVSYAAYLFNSFAVRDFLSETIRLIDKFVY